MLSRAMSVSALFSEHKDLVITDDRAHSTLCSNPTISPKPSKRPNDPAELSVNDLLPTVAIQLH